MQLTYITPQTAEEMAGHYEALRFLHSFVPRDYEMDLKGFLSGVAGFLTVVYSGRLPVACFTLYPFSKGSVEIHGVVRQDLKLLLGRGPAKAVVDHMSGEVLKAVFMDGAWKKLIAKVTPQGKAARVWLRRFGFEQVQNQERGGVTVWKLERRKYLGVVNPYA